MVCKEHLVDALSQTHRALLACSQCIDEASSHEERELLEELSVSLAAQAKVVHEMLLKPNAPRPN